MANRNTWENKQLKGSQLGARTEHSNWNLRENYTGDLLNTGVGLLNNDVIV